MAKHQAAKATALHSRDQALHASPAIVAVPGATATAAKSATTAEGIASTKTASIGTDEQSPALRKSALRLGSAPAALQASS